jgi:hypothetical protein
LETTKTFGLGFRFRFIKTSIIVTFFCFISSKNPEKFSKIINQTKSWGTDERDIKIKRGIIVDDVHACLWCCPNRFT